MSTSVFHSNQKHSKEKKANRNSPKPLQAKIVTAIVIHNRISIGLVTGYSETYNSEIFKLPQVKYNPEFHREYKEDKLKKHALKFFLGEFNPCKIEYTVLLDISKDTKFRIYYVKAGEKKQPGEEIPLANKKTCILYPFDQLYGKRSLMVGESEVRILPSIIRAIEFLPC